MHDNLGKAELLDEYVCIVFVHDNGIINDEWRDGSRDAGDGEVFLQRDRTRRRVKAGELQRDRATPGYCRRTARRRGTVGCFSRGTARQCVTGCVTLEGPHDAV